MSASTGRPHTLHNTLRRYENRIARLEQRDRQLSNNRLLFFLLCFALAAGAALSGHEAAAWGILLLFIAVFIPVVRVHRRIADSLEKHRIRRDILKDQLARVALDFSALPEAHRVNLDPDHPFGIDLDILGETSLHRLLDIGASTGGSDLLAEWLLSTDSTPEVSRRRQNQVRELEPLFIFRNRLLMNYRIASHKRLDSKTLNTWLQNNSGQSSLNKLLPLLTGLTLFTDLTFILNSMAIIATPVWIYSLIAYAGIYLFNLGPVKTLLEEATFLEDEIRKLRSILDHIEGWRYGPNTHLAELCRPITGSASKPSQQLRTVRMLSTAIGLRMNPLMGLVLNIAFPWDFYCAFFLQRFRARLRQVVPDWLKALQHLEALSSLAGFAWLNRDKVYPELEPAETDEHPGLHAEHLGHPLIAADERVCNDFSLQGLGKVVIITGSNMAGKSTFLKTVGVNMVLAQAGAPVLARRFRLSLFRLFSCIKISDSISDGFSYFYAEVRRLKAILAAIDAEDQPPVFFLIDEIFRGTNNRERLIGSRAYLRALIDKRAMGLVSTHDLELVHLADDFPGIVNFHFREQVRDGRMIFDYTLRPGPCPTTNALKIMQLEGLPVDAGQA